MAGGSHPHHSPLGIAWTAVTAVVMFALAFGKARTGAALGNPVLRTEGRVTLIDGLLGAAVLLGLVLNNTLGWWWADPAAGYVLVYYAGREVRAIFFGEHSGRAEGVEHSARRRVPGRPVPSRTVPSPRCTAVTAPRWVRAPATMPTPWPRPSCWGCGRRWSAQGPCARVATAE
ncbi:cation transporter [Kitasatospora sp. LaBMicrA B282]|uniref:cation transporter n=1 Tax=Kitasatospora sp. LaBMicrA B282 TaxID=3420949 RepID=UPI003D0F9EAA